MYQATPTGEDDVPDSACKIKSLAITGSKSEFHTLCERYTVRRFPEDAKGMEFYCTTTKRSFKLQYRIS